MIGQYQHNFINKEVLKKQDGADQGTKAKEEKDFFSAELIAGAYKCAKVIQKSNASSINFLPVNWTSEKQSIHLVGGAVFEKEQTIEIVEQPKTKLKQNKPPLPAPKKEEIKELVPKAVSGRPAKPAVNLEPPQIRRVDSEGLKKANTMQIQQSN